MQKNFFLHLCRNVEYCRPINVVILKYENLIMEEWMFSNQTWPSSDKRLHHVSVTLCTFSRRR